jgi:hypothetical protein
MSKGAYRGATYAESSHHRTKDAAERAAERARKHPAVSDAYVRTNQS